MKIHIFTIMAGCAPVGIKMLESYFKFHSDKINIYCFIEDIKELGDIQSSVIGCEPNFVIHILPESLKESFKNGHEGTAKVWARVIEANKDRYLIHIDSDIIFKNESLSLIEKAGYPDIYGSRRCYQNNPGKSWVPEGCEDAISTYFIGFNPDFIIKPSSNDSITPVGKNLERMIQGAFNPLGFAVLDFFDPVFFWMRYKGAIVYFENPEIIGGQDFNGLKDNGYKSNLHLDMGSHLAHFGGVGSGYYIFHNKLGKQELSDYEKWAAYRWDLFEELMNKSPIVAPEGKPVFDDAGRWVSGPYDYDIFEQIKTDLIKKYV